MVYPVWVARSADEWPTFPSASMGAAAVTYHDEPFASGPSSSFNRDAWPDSIWEGLWTVADVLSEAKRADADAPLHDGYLREDFILHECAGHGVKWVNGAHDAPQPWASNSLMNDDHGHRMKTESDRNDLRAVILGSYDAFEVRRGPPSR